MDRLANDVIDAALDVHRALGPGHVEAIYQRALEVELAARTISFQSQLVVAVPYRGVVVGESHVDLVVGGALVVEVRVVERLLDMHRAQVISHLRAGGFHLGLLINFHSDPLRDGIERVKPDR